ncbi:MAG: type II toxin-antitoxin system RelE/ParE family toxin [Elusimicrobia bacterium]|nr:type II toxin-antitoxin system RelE/ParE family toxin [Elusimicrobiota bacterium]
MLPRIELRRYRTADGRCPFSDWVAGLEDVPAARVMAYVDRMKGGNFGKSRSVGSGALELKIDFGPGFRVYYVREGSVVVVLLCGGNKTSQRVDIRTALKYAADYRDRL